MEGPVTRQTKEGMARWCTTVA